MKPYTGFEKYSDEELIAIAITDGATDLSQELAKRYAATIDAQKGALQYLAVPEPCEKCGHVNNPF